MSKRKDYSFMVGNQYGLLLVKDMGVPKIEKSGRKITTVLCECQCENKTIKTMRASHVLHGQVKCCGCLQRINASKCNTKHGMYKTRIYSVLQGMKSRCYNPNNPEYKDYGGRGITICQEWLDNPMTFIEWAYANGYDDSKRKSEQTIDRIDVNGNYEPGNCRWADDYTQANNTRKNKNYTYNGETHSLSEWGRIKPNGLGYDTLRSRLRDGWSVEDAFTKPDTHGKTDANGTLITINGETHNVTWWCEKTGIQKSTYYRRLKYGWTPERAATEPHHERHIKKEYRK